MKNLFMSTLLQSTKVKMLGLLHWSEKFSARLGALRSIAIRAREWYEHDSLELSVTSRSTTFLRKR